MSQWQGMFLRVKHAWTCLLRVLAVWNFHETVAKGREEGMELSQQTGFQQPGFWITMAGFRIPLAGFRIPKPWIPVPQTKITWIPDSGFRIPDSGLPYMGRVVIRSFPVGLPKYSQCLLSRDPEIFILWQNHWMIEKAILHRNCDLESPTHF